MTTARYDHIGQGYARTRRPDPRLRELIDQAVGDAVTVVDVGAGTGSYEPAGRHVIAIEPSDVMAAQRPRHLAPALRGDLPLRDGSARLALDIRARATAALERDLAAGEWDRCHGHLRLLDRLDAGQRLLVHHPVA